MGSSEKEPPVQALDFLTIGSFNRPLAEELIARVSRRVSVPCRLLARSPRFDLPMLPERDQVDADALLKQLEQEKTAPGALLVGLTMRDLGIRIFTFVFGQARHNGRTALVSLARLRPEFYGLPPDPDRAARRAVAEVLHEVGHVTGLAHCNDFACVMHFATNVESIDLRGEVFCPGCASRLPPGLLSTR